MALAHSTGLIHTSLLQLSFKGSLFMTCIHVLFVCKATYMYMYICMCEYFILLMLIHTLLENIPA